MLSSIYVSAHFPEREETSMCALFNRDLNQAAGSVGVFGFHCQINYFVIQVEVSWS